jgi:hypothetical protein
MIVGIIIFLSFIAILILGIRAMDKQVMEFENRHKNSIGRNHACVVFSHGCGGDIHFDEMNENEIYETLKNLYEEFSVMTLPCINASDDSHLAEIKIFVDENYTTKLIGYITKDKVVFEGKEYNFQ